MMVNLRIYNLNGIDKMRGAYLLLILIISTERGSLVMKRLYRSRAERMVAGILGRIVQHFNIDPTIIRLAFVLCLFNSFGLLLFIYFIGVIIIPNEWEIL